MKKLFIFPYNGNGLEALDCIREEYEFIGFIDDVQEKQGIQEQGVAVFSREMLQKYKEARVLAVPGSPSTYLHRARIIQDLGLPEDRFATIIHPCARISSFAKIGYNVLIMAGVVITSNAYIENHVCILPNTVIHHDVHVGAYSLVGSNTTIAGFVNIGKNCYIGSGSKLKDHIEIGEHSLIGIGTNVIRSLPQKSKAVGNPARIIGDVP
ncbi:acetyltransferase [candidate division KSB3 bacterium]|uniref:Acetyltransferase n=1 Tax=candidate division KSB3 bacterium TaxID=2044937 RepID=A0A9D5JVC9_9BACT|nr:acetyltransferase [candidate division KSB3 bacterium]MBD3324962.1 acetyltransferase [candidate division KSB3 bacterium]